MSVRIKLQLQYQGTGYSGWQAQTWQDGHGHSPKTIEGELQAAWARLTDGLEVGRVFHVAGRTDAGVHAWGQVAHIDTDWPQALRGESIKVLGGLNRYLPKDIRVLRVAQVDENFHARFSAVDRAYAYLLYNRPVLRPDLIGRAGPLVVKRGLTGDGKAAPVLDMMRMWQALQMLPLGPNDYSGFRDSECQSKRPVCDLKWREIVDVGEGMLRINIRADHFLHHMVRNIVGTLVEIGRNQRDVTGLADVLAGRDRRLAGTTYTPDGLYLTRVGYPPHEEHDAVGEVF